MKGLLEEEFPLAPVLLVASILVITLAATSQSSFAQSSNPEELAARATVQSQTPGGTWAVIEAQVKNTLEQAGFQNIRVMPSSFVVQAEKDGQPLTLLIDLDGKTVSSPSQCPKPTILMREERTPIRPSVMIEGFASKSGLWLRAGPIGAVKCWRAGTACWH